MLAAVLRLRLGSGGRFTTVGELAPANQLLCIDMSLLPMAEHGPLKWFGYYHLPTAAPLLGVASPSEGRREPFRVKRLPAAGDDAEADPLSTGWRGFSTAGPPPDSQGSYGTPPPLSASRGRLTPEAGGRCATPEAPHTDGGGGLLPEQRWVTRPSEACAWLCLVQKDLLLPEINSNYQQNCCQMQGRPEAPAHHCPVGPLVHSK